jgi:DNA-directed RNA polymerase specialized sigma24 family protein
MRYKNTFMHPKIYSKMRALKQHREAVDRRHKRIYTLHNLGLKPEEIAKAIGQNRSTVYSALKKVRDMMDVYGVKWLEGVK